MKKKRGEEKKKEEEEEEEEEEERYGKYGTCMECYGFVWKLWFSMDSWVFCNDPY